MKKKDTEDGARVLLVYPNPAMDNLIPIGISLLSAHLKNAGHSVKLFDTTFYESGREIGEHLRERNLQVLKTDLKEAGVERVKNDLVEDFKSTVEEYKPDLVGVSAVEIGYLQGIKLLEGIEGKGIPRIMGGVHPTFSPDEVIREKSVDMIWLGEGEDAIVELADRIRDGKDYSDVQNLWVKKDREVIKNELRPLKNLDDLLFQDWGIYDKKRYYKPFLGGIVVTAAIETSRGCPGVCTFCCNPVLQEMYRGRGNFIRVKKIENVINEVRYLRDKYNINFIKFADADFLIKSKKDFMKFVKLYEDVKIPFWCEARAGMVTEERATLLEKVGCKGFAVGVESGNDYIRNEILRKNTKREDIVKAFKILNKTNMRICANFIIGVPYETREHIFDTIELAKELNLDNPIVNIFNPYRGTFLRELCVKEGYIDKTTIAGDYRGECVLTMPQISDKELLGLQRTFPMYVKFPKDMWSEIKRAEREDDLFEKLSEVYTAKYLSKKKCTAP